MLVKTRRATEDDLSFIGWAMYAAARSQLHECPWNTILGERKTQTRRFLEYVSQSRAVHWCHVSTFWIAEVDGKPAAAMSSYAPATEGAEALAQSILDVAESEFDFPRSRLRQVSERLQTATLGLPNDLPEVWGVENVAVVPAHRGKGLVERLFDRVFEEGREKGFDRAQILCLIGNLRAQRAWERNGFEVFLQQTSPAFDRLFGTPGAKLLARDL